MSRFGAIAFEPVFDLCRDPAVTGYSRTHAASAALNTAGDDSARRARLADVLRPLLADAIESFRQEPLLLGTDEPDDFDDETLDDDFDEDSSDAELEDALEYDGEFDEDSDDEPFDDDIRESAEKQPDAESCS